ncbi:hypothetical protein BU17DRAFT_91470 [Hysterangium stoloniferum]|nr:hypothetical protein BU17DRAFT_91470 [Hysterangium stoloniferum]
MTERIPASLAYLLIYNPTLLPPTTTSGDDEDAQEEAHILFYTSRDRVASRDRMLRQVGLAKALVAFSDIFAPGQGCDNVHSQGKRMVSISPEPDFWMHVCVDLAKTPKQTKDKNKVRSAKDAPAAAAPQLYYYHEESVFDQVLKDSMYNGYEAFKLLYGTYSSILKDGNPEVLQTRLERFFTPWAWHWDIESCNDLHSHLGLSLHPLSKSLTPTISSFIKELPPTTHPVLVSPPHIIPCSSDPEFAYPSSLARYLLSLTPLTGRSSPRRMSIKGKEPIGNRLNHKDGGSNNGNSTSRFFMGGLGDVMNVKRWTWSGTFGGTGSKLSQQIDQNMPSSSSIDKPGNTINSDSSTLPEELTTNKSTVPDVLTHEQPDVDQSALEDAMSHPAPCESYEPVLSTMPQESLSTDRHDNEPVNNNLPVVAASKRSFLATKVYLSEPSAPLITREQRLLRLTEAELTLGLLTGSDWFAKVDEQSLEDLACKCEVFLRQIRDVLDGQLESGKANTKTGDDKSKHIIGFDRSLTSHGKIPATATPYFLESQSLIDSNISEVFSRSIASQNWVVTKRGITLPNNGGAVQSEASAFMVVNHKEASLVDADNEIEGIARRWRDSAI